jgi:hypothetical protein
MTKHINIFRNVMSLSLLEIHRRFGGTYSLRNLEFTLNIEAASLCGAPVNLYRAACVLAETRLMAGKVQPTRFV